MDQRDEIQAAYEALDDTRKQHLADLARELITEQREQPDPQN